MLGRLRLQRLAPRDLGDVFLRCFAEQSAQVVDELVSFARGNLVRRTPRSCKPSHVHAGVLAKKTSAVFNTDTAAVQDKPDESRDVLRHALGTEEAAGLGASRSAARRMRCTFLSVLDASQACYV